jgi:hypothetical protein
MADKVEKEPKEGEISPAVVSGTSCELNCAGRSYCPDDDNPNPRATIRLLNQKLREGGTWHVLHWRPDGESKIFEKNAAEHAKLKRLDRGQSTPFSRSAGSGKISLRHCWRRSRSKKKVSNSR